MNLIIILSFICFSVFVLAENECDKLYERYKESNPNEADDDIRGCYSNDEGQINYLFIRFNDFSKELSSTIDSLEHLSIREQQFTQEYIDNIAKQTNLTELEIQKCNFDENLNFNPLKSLTKLEQFQLWDENENKIKEFPEFLFSLTSLKTIMINQQNIVTIPDSFEHLVNLEKLDLHDNKLDCEVPQSLNNLPNLKNINFSDNKNIKGKTLTNDNIKDCKYGNNVNELCKAEEMKCFDNYGDLIINCKNKISTDGTCGMNKGKCPDGECCSRFGWCGTSEKHCLVSNGCQSKFGNCILLTPSPDLPISTNGRCGEKYGKCPSGQCCSRYGWCGKSSDYCDIGCQSIYGDCN